MQLPELHGNLSFDDFFIYAACDEKYFDEFGKSFVNSVNKNSGCKLHLHLYNPRQDQIDFCLKSNVSITYEYVIPEMFISAAQHWSTVPVDEVEKSRYDRILGAMQKSNDANIVDRLQKTYYACARFVRLKQILKPSNTFFALDVDAIVRKQIPFINGVNDIYMHSITGRKARTLAGALFCSSFRGFDFVKRYSDILEKNIKDDYLYWGLDQDVLPGALANVSLGQIPMTYIDWEMRPDSTVWTAKGKRKDLEIFIVEKKKYSA
jgi:hypothetical protein